MYIYYKQEFVLKNYDRFCKCRFVSRILAQVLKCGPKGLMDAAEGCSPPQELEKAARRAAIFLVSVKVKETNFYSNEKP